MLLCVVISENKIDWSVFLILEDTDLDKLCPTVGERALVRKNLKTIREPQPQVIFCRNLQSVMSCIEFGRGAKGSDAQYNCFF